MAHSSDNDLAHRRGQLPLEGTLKAWLPCRHVVVPNSLQVVGPSLNLLAHLTLRNVRLLEDHASKRRFARGSAHQHRRPFHPHSGLLILISPDVSCPLVPSRLRLFETPARSNQSTGGGHDFVTNPIDDHLMPSHPVPKLEICLVLALSNLVCLFQEVTEAGTALKSLLFRGIQY